jgi:hypothetical protein
MIRGANRPAHARTAALSRCRQRSCSATVQPPGSNFAVVSVVPRRLVALMTQGCWKDHDQSPAWGGAGRTAQRPHATRNKEADGRSRRDAGPRSASLHLARSSTGTTQIGGAHPAEEAFARTMPGALWGCSRNRQSPSSTEDWLAVARVSLSPPDRSAGNEHRLLIAVVARGDCRLPSVPAPGNGADGSPIGRW